MKKPQILALCCVGLLPNAVAEVSDDFWYMGVDIGQSYYDNGGNEAAYDSERHRLMGGLHLGYQFNDYFATELAYQYLGKAKAHYDDGFISGEVQQGVMSARLGYPVTDNLYPYLTLGGAGWVSNVKGLNNVDSNGFSPVFGAGLSYALTDNLALRAEYQFTQSLGDNEVGFTDHHLTTVGVSWRFGVTPKPAPIIQEKVVEVIKVVEQPIENNKLITLSAETLFEHNSSQLVKSKPLEKVLAFLVQYPTSTITITGHTDNTGTEHYNQWMSARRAQSVARFFVANGINQSRISALGKGEAEPIADNLTEEGRAMNRRVEMIVQPLEMTSPAMK